MAEVKLLGDWNGVAQGLAKAGNPLMWRTAMDQAMGREAHRLERIIKKGFNSGGPKGVKWKPLSQMTINMRKAQGFRGTRPLMRAGDLRGSIKTVKDGDTWFVGVHKSAKSKDGKDLIDIASVQELGTKKEVKVKVTDAMRGFFYQMFKKSTTPAQRRRLAKGKGSPPKFAIFPLAPSTTVIVFRIPARPFIGPVWDAEGSRSQKNIVTHVLRSVGLGKFVK